MVFDDEIEQGTWFPFFESHFDFQTGEIVYHDPKPDAAEFCIRSIAPIVEEIQAKKKKEYQMVLNPKTRSMERVSFYPDLSPEEALKEKGDIWEYAITGIRGNATWADGKPIQKTREDILRLLKLPVFDRFLGRVVQLLSEQGVGTKEAEIKNLWPGHNG